MLHVQWHDYFKQCKPTIDPPDFYGRKGIDIHAKGIVPN